MKINTKEFEDAINKGLKQIKPSLREKIDNLEFIIEEEPNNEQKQEFKLRKNTTLFGLYEGVPKTQRGAFYGGVLPDKITIFKKPIEESAKDKKELEQIVIETVIHEVAHHFGLEEKEVKKREAEKWKKKTIKKESNKKEGFWLLILLILLLLAILIL